MTGEQTWRTPPAFFDAVTAAVPEAARHGWALDAAATLHDRMIARYIAPPGHPDAAAEAVDGLASSWADIVARNGDVGPVWCNPPYHNLAAWVRKAYTESRAGAVTVLLGLASTDTEWWHEYAIRADEIWLLRGRIRFVHPVTGEPGPSPRSQSAVLVYRPHWDGTTPRIMGRDASTLDVLWRA